MLVEHCSEVYDSGTPSDSVSIGIKVGGVTLLVRVSGLIRKASLRRYVQSNDSMTLFESSQDDASAYVASSPGDSDDKFGSGHIRT